MTYYRPRESALGDVINASPVFVGKPSFRYIENGYTTFASTNASRTAWCWSPPTTACCTPSTAITGNERWAYMPSLVLPNLYKLADTDYGSNHRYYVDGSPQMGDIYVGGQWKTILVGGLNGGGRGYYALDVTNPAAPKLLWEFTNANLGLTFGNPVITKRDGRHLGGGVRVGLQQRQPGRRQRPPVRAEREHRRHPARTFRTYTSGTTPAGTPATPSGLAKVNVWIDSDINNLARRFYAGDLLGNLWRFDIDGLVQPFQSALLLAQLKDCGRHASKHHGQTLARAGDLQRGQLSGGLRRDRPVPGPERPGQHHGAVGLRDQGSAHRNAPTAMCALPPALSHKRFRRERTPKGSRREASLQIR